MNDAHRIATSYLQGDGPPEERVLCTTDLEFHEGEWVAIVRDGAGEVIEQRDPTPGEMEALLAQTEPPAAPLPEEVPTALASAEQRITQLEAQLAAILAALGQD